MYTHDAPLETIAPTRRGESPAVVRDDERLLPC